MSVYLYNKIKQIEIMTTLKSQNGIEIKFNGKNNYLVVSAQKFGTSDVIYGAVDTERKANNLFNKVLKSSGLS